MIPIVVPVRNLSWMTINFLESVKRTTSSANLRVIVVDSGSDEVEVAALASWLKDSGLNFLHDVKAESLGFVRAVNLGMGHALQTQAPYFFVANNDVLCTDQWLERMSDSFKNDRVGLVGPMTSPPDWRETDAGRYMVEKRIRYFQVRDDLERFAAPLREHLDGVESKTDFVPLFFAGVNSNMVREVGMLDERFGEGLFDDDDWCFRAQKAGWRMVVRKDVLVHHYHNSTFLEVHGRAKYMEMLRRNRVLFKEIHGVDPLERRGIRG